MTIQIKKKHRLNVSIWIVISIIFVIAIISAALTFSHFQRQKEQAVELLLEKGATLIRSFEAGLRGPAIIKDNTYYLQKLLMETAEQPNIDYIIITDSDGNIIADSEPSLISERYGLDLDRAGIAAKKDIHWRQTANPGGAGTFEVYRGFFPLERFEETKAAPADRTDEQKNKFIIYVGLNMAAIEKASKEDTRNTIIIALILLLIGSSVIVSLFLMQAYLLAQTSLSRITVFSEALVKNMPIGLIALDEKDTVATCNEKAAAILNIDGSDIIGKKALFVLPAPLQKTIDELPENGGLVEKDLRLDSRNDKNKILEVVAAGLTDDGTSAGKIVLLRDVTALRQLENEVAKSRHLSSIGSLAAGVAHEIRNPLSSIKGFAVYFKERLAGNDEDQKTADIMIQEVERLNRVISQLIEFARPLELKLEKIQFADLVQHSIALITAEAKKNQINILTETFPDLPPVKGDPDKIKQVLLNILLNSLAAMKNGGNIFIKFAQEKNGVAVIISDTGSGIEKGDLPRIYDPYFTSKPAGTGLGLAVVQKIMEGHGGAINIESAIGKGTAVTLRFPFSPANHGY